MGKKFAEYQKFNLSEINKEVLKKGAVLNSSIFVEGFCGKEKKLGFFKKRTRRTLWKVI